MRIALGLSPLLVLAMTAGASAAPAAAIIGRAPQVATDQAPVILAQAKKKAKKQQREGRPPAAVREERGS